MPPKQKKKEKYKYFPSLLMKGRCNKFGEHLAVIDILTTGRLLGAIQKMCSGEEGRGPVNVEKSRFFHNHCSLGQDNISFYNR